MAEGASLAGRIEWAFNAVLGWQYLSQDPAQGCRVRCADMGQWGSASRDSQYGVISCWR